MTLQYFIVCYTPDHIQYHVDKKLAKIALSTVARAASLLGRGCTHVACCHRHATVFVVVAARAKKRPLSCMCTLLAAAPVEERLIIRFLVWRGGGGRLGNLHGEKSKGGNMTTQMLIFETELHL